MTTSRSSQPNKEDTGEQIRAAMPLGKKPRIRINRASVPSKDRGKGPTHHERSCIMPKRIRTINGKELYDLIRDRDNVELAVKNACKDHAHDPAVIRIRENPEPYVDAVCRILDEQSFHLNSAK